MRDFNTNVMTLKAFDLNTFAPVGSATLAGISGEATTLVRWGTNGLAFRTTTNQLYVLQTSLIPSGDPIPTPTPTPPATPTPTPTYIPTLVRTVNQPANDLAINPATQTLYASVPSTAGAAGNSIVPIDPQTGTVGANTFVGSEPNKLALSDDGQFLYVSLDGTGAVRRVDVATLTAGPQFSLGGSQFNGPMSPKTWRLRRVNQTSSPCRGATPVAARATKASPSSITACSARPRRRAIRART